MHVAIMMNGAGRWATRRGVSAAVVPTEGVVALQATVQQAALAGVRTLTLYAIGATDRAARDPEIDANLRILSAYLRNHSRYCQRKSIQVSVIGECPRPAAQLLRAMERQHLEPAGGTRLHLRIVVDYSAHDSVVQSTWCNISPCAPETFTRRLREVDDTALPAGAVDLLIRTGAGKCLSDYLLWEVAYARLHCADCLWPDFSAREFQRALAYYRHKA